MVTMPSHGSEADVEANESRHQRTDVEAPQTPRRKMIVAAMSVVAGVRRESLGTRR